MSPEASALLEEDAGKLKILMTGYRSWRRWLVSTLSLWSLVVLLSHLLSLAEPACLLMFLNTLTDELSAHHTDEDAEEKISFSILYHCFACSTVLPPLWMKLAAGRLLWVYEIYCSYFERINGPPPFLITEPSLILQNHTYIVVHDRHQMKPIDDMWRRGGLSQL
jgi:hypothetical protein